MTKKLIRTPWIWAILAVALAVPAVHATEVNNITVGRFEDFTVVTLYGDAPLTVTHQMVAAKNGKPDRIVVDVTGAEHGLPDNNFRDLPKSTITAIRTSQFAVSPEPVVRVVLDLAHSAAYQMKIAGRRARIMVSLPQDPPIPLEWSARDLSTGNVYAASENVTHPAPATNAAASSDLPTVNSETANSEAEPNPAAVPDQADQAPSTFAQSESGSEMAQHDDIVPMPMPKDRPEEEINYDVPVPGSENLAQATMPAGDEPVAEASDSDLPKAMPESEELASAGNPPATEEMPVAEATPIPDEGSLPVASLTTLPPTSSVPEQIIPERESVVYHTNGLRDPFAPLIKVGGSFNAAALPDVSSLRMVGVLHDVKNSWGLFEDANGYGYILKQGDRVRNGRLAKLTEDKAFFQLTEFGWSRSVELDLEREG